MVQDPTHMEYYYSTQCNLVALHRVKENLANIGSINGLSAVLCQAIAWTNAD